MFLKIKFIVISLLLVSFAFGQDKLPQNSDSSDSIPLIKHRHSVGSSFFMFGNLLEESPDYILLTYGYQLTSKDRIFAEFNTWKYSEPLGTYGNSPETYPGYVRAFGIGVGYQRFLWKGVFTTVQATPFINQYYTVDNDKIQKGFQLYLQFIAGYRFEFFKKRWYLEPAIALKYWPVDTNYPNDFAKIEKGTPKYIFEPSLNFGFKF